MYFNQISYMTYMHFNKISYTTYLISCMIVYLFQLNDMYSLFSLSKPYSESILSLCNFLDFLYQLRYMHVSKLITSYSSYYKSIQNVLSYSFQDVLSYSLCQSF